MSAYFQESLWRWNNCIPSPSLPPWRHAFQKATATAQSQFWHLHKSISVTTTARTPRSAAVKFRKKIKTRQDGEKNTANVVKLFHCCSAVGWLHWQVSDERFSGTSCTKSSHGFCYYLEFYNMTCKCVCVFMCVRVCCLMEEAAHMNPSVQDSWVNAVDKAIGLTWQSIVLISPVSLSI